MTPKELKRLSRSDLLEMMLEVTQENAKLRKEIEQLRSQLNQRTITIKNCGSLAEASLRLTDIFRSAQESCDIYVENIRQRQESLEQTCRQMELETQRKCAAMLEQAQACLQDAGRRSQEKASAYPWLSDLMDGEAQ